jgi:catalase
MEGNHEKTHAAGRARGARICVTGLAHADDQPVETAVIDAMNKAFGVHPGFRANHAKGVVVEGSFTASPEAAALSKAILFDGSKIPVTVRFSDATGIPDLPDGAGAANPHGMAIKFHLPDGSDTDMVTTPEVFPVSTGGDFRDLLLAVAASPPDAAKPTKFDELWPPTRRCPPPLPPPPRRTASPTRCITASTRSCSSTGRASDRPCATRCALGRTSDAAAGKKPANFMQECPRVATGPVTFHLKRTAAPAMARRTRPSLARRPRWWTRHLTIDKAVADSAEAERRCCSCRVSSPTDRGPTIR